MPSCIKWGEERHQECSQTENRGYNECTESRDEGYRDCCDWAPCSWFCDAWVWISNIVCVVWTWVSNIVCVAWTWITTAVCVVWDIITTVINAILVTIESILGWVASAIGFIIELIEMIPVLGTFVRWIINIVTTIVWTIVALGDAFLGLIGIRPEKLLRVCTVILRDENENPAATEEYAVELLQVAASMYKRDANIRLIPLGPFKYSSGFLDEESVTSDWVHVNGGSSDNDTLDVGCGADGVGSEWLLSGSKYQWIASTCCFYGAWRRVLGYGAPITCFVIRSIPGALGCSLWITDYITVVGEQTLPSTDPGYIPPTSPRTIGHELGHSCNLWHVCVDSGVTNLMATQGDCDPASTTPPDRVNPELNNWQVLLARASKHVSYF